MFLRLVTNLSKTAGDCIYLFLAWGRKSCKLRVGLCQKCDRGEKPNIDRGQVATCCKDPIGSGGGEKGNGVKDPCTHGAVSARPRRSGHEPPGRKFAISRLRALGEGRMWAQDTPVSLAQARRITRSAFLCDSGRALRMWQIMRTKPLIFPRNGRVGVFAYLTWKDPSAVAQWGSGRFFIF